MTLLDDKALREVIANTIYFNGVKNGQIDPEDNKAVSRMFDLVKEQQRAYGEAARSNDPHLCEFGHEVYSHKTVDGYCCACEADIAFMEGGK